MKTAISSNGTIVVPGKLRKQDRLVAGQMFEIERIERGKYLLTRQATADNEGLVDLLLSCPAKGWFQAL